MIMTGKMKNPNKYPEVVTSPTRYRGGMNAYPQVVQNPTRYRGGMNAAACDVSKYMKK
jgi:hypothetical protein